MGRKRKYFTEEEAREAQNRRRRKSYLFSRQFDQNRGNVLMAEKLFETYFDPKQIKTEYGMVNQKDIYLYALIGVDTTISSLVQRLHGFDEGKIKESTTNTKTLVRIANQLRFREWLIEKTNLLELGATGDDGTTTESKPNQYERK